MRNPQQRAVGADLVNLLQMNCVQRCSYANQLSADPAMIWYACLICVDGVIYCKANLWY